MNYNNNTDNEYVEAKYIQNIINILNDKYIPFAKLQIHINKAKPHKIPHKIWNKISIDSRITPDFLTKYQNHINWNYLSKYFNFQDDDNNILFSEIFQQKCNLYELVNNKSIIYTVDSCMWGFNITINYD